jgi:hypothetical protein
MPLGIAECLLAVGFAWAAPQDPDLWAFCGTATHTGSPLSASRDESRWTAMGELTDDDVLHALAAGGSGLGACGRGDRPLRRSDERARRPPRRWR